MTNKDPRTEFSPFREFLLNYTAQNRPDTAAQGNSTVFTPQNPVSLSDSEHKSFIHNLIHFNSIDSTNAYALREMTALSHDSVIIANRQSAGRGRLERHWISDSDENLYMSIVIKPDRPWREIPLVNFTQYFSLCLCRVLAAYGVTPLIKWPNDVLVEGAKIAGILSETVFEGSQFLGMVLGIGVNLNSDPSAEHSIDQNVTALASHTGKKTDLFDFAGKLFDEYRRNYQLFVSGGFSAIKQDFITFFPYIGKEVMIKNSTVNGPATVQDISDSGELIILDESGSIKSIALGDMIWRP